MNFLEKLEYLMEKNKIKNLHDLSTKSKIPYSTLRGFYTKGTENIKLPTLKHLAKFFNCSMEYLGDDEITEITPYGISELEDQEIESLQKMLRNYKLLDENEVLTNDKFNHIIEILQANKKFILISDESKDNSN
ncbi:MAG: helix-turn-helix transcriptional regulator [Bacilli bacterium]